VGASVREQEEPATQMMLKPHGSSARRGEMHQTMQERTGQVRESMEQGGGSYGPIVVGMRGSAVGRSDDPHAMTGMEYGEISINNKVGVNASEYGNKGAAWKVMCVCLVLPCSPPVPHHPNRSGWTPSHAFAGAVFVVGLRAPLLAVPGEDHLGQPKVSETPVEWVALGVVAGAGRRSPCHGRTGTRG